LPSSSRYLRHLAFAGGFCLLLLLFYWPVTAGNRTMLPADALYLHQPWRSFAPEGFAAPHNSLITDLVFENYVWKQFILECLRDRQLPLWNPYILAGVPFLAAGQHSALYPFSLIYYVVPLTRAYGLFTVSQLLLAGLSLYFYARTIRLSRLAAAAGSFAFAFSGFMLVSTVFPMIIATAAWLPFLLAITERLSQAVSEGGSQGRRLALRAPLPWLVLGSLALGCQVLAGHVEFLYYNLLVLAAYGAWRAVGEFVRPGRWRALAVFAGLLGAMVALGLGLAAVQILPLYEHVTRSFREGSVTYEQIVGWAYPFRRLIAFLIPDFFGNPSHHSYMDLYTGQVLPTLRDGMGRLRSTEWGLKNYVEGGAYISLLALLFALVGALRRPRRQAWFFIALALFSLSLVFGLPTYWLVYQLPGIRQLHSPFRWVFPYTVAIAVLAAMGVDAVAESVARRDRGRLHRALGLLAALAALATVGTVAAARALPRIALPLADRAVARLAKASEAFADGRMFLSYQARNLLIFAGCLAGAGAVLLGARYLLRRGGRLGQLWGLALLAVLFLDPAAWFRGLMPATGAETLTMRSPAIEYLQQQPQPFRITVFDTRSTKPLPANTNMLYGLQDVRGYDSIIPRQYCEVMELVGPQELLYNQIARLTREASLDSPILDLLNVRYVLTEETIQRPGYTLVHDGDLRVYRNDDALPRAFVTFRARVFADRQSLLEALPQTDPRELVLLEVSPKGWVNPDAPPAPPEVTFLELSPNQVRLHVDMPAPGFLVLADNYFPGWVAYTSPDATGEEQALEILRADGTVRAVLLPAGPQTVRFKYSPGSLKTGLFISFIAGVSLLLVAGAWVWAGAFRPSADEHAARRVAKNTVVPLALQLLNKGVDMVFAMLMLRLLGPGDAGKYAFAVYVAVLLEVVTNFGLNTLLTREVARNREDANAYLWNTTVLRLGLAAAAAPLLALFLVIYRPARDTSLAIVLLALGLIPSSISAGLSAVFMAFEVMVIPAVVSSVTTVLKVALGAAALLLGWGFVGLAGTSIAVNTVTMAILLGLVVALFFRPHPDRRPGLPRRLALESYPLMINHLLATLFFKVDYFILERMWGSAVVGWYSVSYKLVDAIGIIPPTFTMAIFPIMSRFAASSRESLYRAYTLSIKLLFSLGLLIALVCTVVAYPLTRLIGGAAYLPHSAIALQIIVWYMPLGFINSVTQYVLIALDQQRFLTKAFAIGLACGVAANLVLIPSYGYRAAAAVHIFSEAALLVPFYAGVRKHLSPIPWLRLCWRPAVAAAAAGLVSWLVAGRSSLLAALLGASVYLALLVVLGAFDAEDRALLAEVIPLRALLARLRQSLQPGQPEVPSP